MMRRLGMAGAVLTVCCLGLPRISYSAGVTGHVVAGELVISQLKDRELKSLLQKWDNAYLNGTMFPDAILKSMGDDPDADLTSHGRTQEVSAPPKGVVAYLWDNYWQECPSGPSSDSCGQKMAYLMGIITHWITDAPWHHQYINFTTDTKCDAQGGPSNVSRQLDGDVSESTSGGRHAVADTDFDFCLARALRGSRGDVEAPLLGVRPPCPPGTFLDPRSFGECWTCPAGTQRTAYAVTDARACTDCLGGRCGTTANRDGSSASLLSSCPSGTFPKVGTTQCYSCPSGYRHDGALTVDSPGVCYRTEQLSSATYVGKAEGTWRDKCSLVSPPSNMRTSLAPLQGASGILDNLVSALNKDGHGFSNVGIQTVLTGFNSIYSLATAAANVTPTPAGPICSWVLEHGIDGRGALSDSAAESAKFLDALWSYRSVKRDVSVIRIDTFEYAIVKGGKALYQNWHRDCGSGGTTCAAPAQCTVQKGQPLCQVLQCPSPDTAATTDIGATIAWTRDSTAASKLFFFLKGHTQVGCAPYLRYDVEGDKPDPGYPQSTRAWQGLPALLDAGFTYQGKAYFFWRDSYYRWDIATDTIDENYPKSISANWKGMSFTNLDAAINLDDKSAYFFKGSQYIKYDLTKDQAVDGFPKEIKSGWNGMPADFASGLSGALVLKGKVYFFKRQRYVRFDITTDRVDQDPADISQAWKIPLRKSP